MTAPTKSKTPQTTKSSQAAPSPAGSMPATKTSLAPLPSKTKRERVFSGIQPTGTAHLGNYLGAIRNWVNEQDVYENIYCIVDLHALTLPREPAELRDAIRRLAATLLACGIDTKRSALFAQSHVHEHAELAWIFDCITPLGWLNRMTQFKTKAGEDREAANAGLYTYPVLMAADILLYQSDAVPVGEDQRQHIELTRDIASTFNHRFGETFVEPRALIREEGARIMSLAEPEKKMSKSDNEASYIALLDSADVIRKKIARATTDSQRTIVFDENRPGIYNLLMIYRLLGDQTPEQIEQEFEGKGYKEFKAALTDRVVAELEPIRLRYEQLMREPAELDRLLAEGAARVRPIAAQTLRTTKERVGLL